MEGRGDGKRQGEGEPEIHAFRFMGLCHIEQSNEVLLLGSESLKNSQFYLHFSILSNHDCILFLQWSRKVDVTDLDLNVGEIRNPEPLKRGGGKTGSMYSSEEFISTYSSDTILISDLKPVL